MKMKITKEKVLQILEPLAEWEGGVHVSLKWWEEREKDRIRESAQRYATTLALFPESENPLKVLDVGTGFGHLAILAKRLFHHNVSGIDWEVPDFVKQRFEEEEMELRECDLVKDSLPYDDQSFDLLLFCDILHLLPIDPRRTFQELSRVLKKGGWLILFTPNSLNLITRIKFLIGRIKTDWEHEYPHFHHYTLDEVRSLLKLAHFSIEREEFHTFATATRDVDLGKRMFLLLYRGLSNLHPPFRDAILVRAMREG
jgi:ubiquinone/menaquinone biosynthesis C-methylase UbiE